MRTCTECGRLLAPKNRGKRCGECSRRYHNQKTKETRDQNAKWIDCAICGKHHRRRPNSTYCSPECSNEGDRILTKRYTAAHSTARKQCVICDKTIDRTTRKGNAITCSEVCGAKREAQINAASRPKKGWAKKNPEKRRKICAIYYRRKVNRKNPIGAILKLQQQEKANGEGTGET